MTRRGWFASIAAALAARFVPVRPVPSGSVPLAVLRQHAPFSDYFDLTGPKIGDTVKMRKPARFVAYKAPDTL